MPARNDPGAAIARTLAYYPAADCQGRSASVGHTWRRNKACTARWSLKAMLSTEVYSNCSIGASLLMLPRRCAAEVAFHSTLSVQAGVLSLSPPAMSDADACKPCVQLLRLCRIHVMLQGILHTSVSATCAGAATLVKQSQSSHLLHLSMHQASPAFGRYPTNDLC